MNETPKLFVTGATGHLGGLVIDELIAMVPSARIVAGVRDTAGENAIALRDKGIEIRIADYSDPQTLTKAFKSVDRLLFISGSEIGKRVTQHRNVINAARDAGIGSIAYTSILHADTSPLFLAQEHRDTEAALAEANIPHTLLRNGWYTEVYTWRLPLALKHNVLIGAAGAGRVSSAARVDYAKAAATVLTSDDHIGKTYELAGDDSFTMAQLANVVADATGAPMEYQDMAAEDFRNAAIEAGVPEMFASVLSDTDAGVAQGALSENGGDLAKLIGRPTTPFWTTITDFLRQSA
ncbi:SDR family oxidoreductase [Stakelama sp. CBK3Z-3]|uniref:SDR family oxidoreductase n=1 Tax=Stakelama flava TaxID=2860338 RepID=A0ABS6XIY8_9SPHN|nr:SDR family oxidoreductase [Stakelama flava]MBW4330096.1 SDR family oxidoreductase [Stakelama flava]